jgi:Tfp pilus assembly protein PilN
MLNLLQLLRHAARRLFGKRLHLSIGSQRILLAQMSSGWEKTSAVLADEALIPSQLKQQADVLLAHPSCTALPLLITLSNEWGRLFIVTPPQNPEQFSDLVAAAKMRFYILYGKDQDDWTIDADWQMQRPFLACAYPRALLNTLYQLAKEQNHLLLSVQPYFLTVWNKWRLTINSTAWFGVVQDGVITLGIVSELQPPFLVGIRSIPIQEHTSQWMEEQLKRIALQSNIPIPQQVQLVGNLDGYWKNKGADAEQLVINLEEQAKRSWVTDLFLRPSSAMQLDFAPASIVRTIYLTRIRTWFLSATGLALCLSAAFFGFHQLNKIDENEKLLQQLSLQLNTRNNKNSLSQKSSVTEGQINKLQANAVNTAIEQLNLPWHDVLNAMESATPATVALLSLEPDAHRNALKGIAEVKDNDGMVHYIELLKKEDFFSSVFLTRHEINQLDSSKPIRFQFEAHWQISAR